MVAKKKVAKKKVAKKKVAKKPPSMFVAEGCVLRNDAVVLAGGYNKQSGEEVISLVAYLLDKQWRRFEVRNDTMISVAANPDTDRVYVVGSAGIALEFPLRPNVTRDEINDELRMWLVREEIQRGELLRVRVIAGQPYCCGQGGQIYRLGEEAWACVDEGLLSPTLEFEDIAGSGPSDIYAVGLDWKGSNAMVRFDGRQWARVDLPTSVNLSNICCASSQLYYVCGDDGVIMSGCGDSWEVLAEEPDKSYWGLEVFDGSVYAAHNSGIDRLTDGKVEPVNLQVKGDLSFHRLHSGGGQLWSFGEDHIVAFDGKRWTKITSELW